MTRGYSCHFDPPKIALSPAHHILDRRGTDEQTGDRRAIFEEGDAAKTAAVQNKTHPTPAHAKALRDTRRDRL
jgi:hypothetical protein